MMRNRHLSRAIGDMGFHEFRRQLEYKARMYGRKLVFADRWFASSKICSCCGSKREKLSLSVRRWTCSNCGIEHDRDINAARNLEKLAVGSTVTACGEEGSGRMLCVSGETGLREAGIQRQGRVPCVGLKGQLVGNKDVKAQARSESRAAQGVMSQQQAFGK